MSTALPNLKSLTSIALKEQIALWGVEGYRYDQLYQWIYQKDIEDFDQITNLSKDLKIKLKENFVLERWEPSQIQTSQDGTKKFLFKLNDQESVESVLIPNGPRQTLCISSQVGCAMACSFCLTGRLGLTRNLSHFEIVEQVMAVRRYVASEVRISNIVFMGMGEPMHNLKNVLEALRFLENERGLNFSKNKITVSTCGLVPQMLEFGKQSQVKLAISLTGTTDEQRNPLIPINRRYPLETLMEACRQYPLPGRGRITFEYTLLKDINDSLEDAARLKKLLYQIPAKVNLIPFNEYPGAIYQRTSEARMLAFQKYLLDRGLQTNIRHSRGLDILGACGQLKAAMEPKRTLK
ncbi:MAG: 23S rRNA (adenine(2503)-C(2))-methyltransferase RlmN [Deltaproteobacteria bacterium]|nr:23S rRNA (adenine(2503)-C(2))-methyltransferase RlmN [Deltaproteobacteria bacterium]